MTHMTPSREEATLLVPMHLDALVVNSTIKNLPITYNRWQMNYDQMNRFANPEPGQFIDQKTDPPPDGVHLHWALPDGLTHGVANEKGDIEFPLVPNRWLVVRIQSGPDHDRPGPVKAWVLISDAYGDDCTSPYVDPHASQPGNIIPTRLGKKVALADWKPKPDEEEELFLTAIASGNVTFAAFAPGVENVFAFHDDLGEMGATKLTYLVVGWYSQPKMDPLDKDKRPPALWQCKFLFNISSQFRDELDQRLMSGVLRQVFKDNGIDLPKKPRVLIDQPGSAWRIPVRHEGLAIRQKARHRPRRKRATVPGKRDITYTARQEDDGINIYESTVTVVDHLQWAVELEGKSPPTRTLVHGMVYDVDWKPEGALSEPINIPDRQTIRKGVRIAVGNTSMDALVALINSQAKSAGLEGQIPTEFLEALEAFQYNLLSTLDQVGSKTLLDQQIRQNWFGSDPGGIRWTIVAKERADDRADQKLPRISSDQEARLAELNEKQRELDAERRIMASMQWELYALWWKSKRIELEDRGPYHQADLLERLASQVDLQESGSFVNQVKAQKQKVERLAQAVPHENGSEKDIEDYAKDKLGLDPEELELKPVAMPRFWNPTDPVVLISGLGRPPEQGQEGNLLCRLASQIIDGITVPYQGKSIRLSAGDYKDLIPSLSHEHLPAAVDQLLSEAFILDPGSADIIARNSPRSPVTRDSVEKAILEIQPDPPEGTSVIGRYGALEWKQPWSPLFIDWQVSYHYTFEQQGGSFEKDSAGNYIFSRESWSFDGTDATWAGPEPSPQHRRSYSGRTFLTPNAPLTFLDRLLEYLQSQPNIDLKADEAFLERIANWDILSQTLSGFSDQLILRDLDYTVLPYGPISEYMDDHHQGVPFMTIVPDPGKGTPFFFPLRAGFLKFEALRIVDKFGRTLNLLYANNNHSDSEDRFLPIRGRGMISSKVRDKRLVELPPRVVQSSRLNFRFVSATKGRQETGLAADANPVCGWLLPNYIAKSISVYQADGNLLGELYLTRKSKEEQMACWQPAPGTPDSSPAGNQQAKVRITNHHLKHMIEALIHRNDQGAAFSNLQQVIDERLWTIDPLGQRDDQNLPVLIGHPLALVRANLQLELSGKPFCNQAWVETFVEGSSRLKENSGGLLDLDFPVRLGSQDLRNDGLIGYFQGTNDQETDYNLFHAVHCPTFDKGEIANPPYIIHIGANDDYVRLKFKATTPMPFDPADSVYLTMLIDPRGVIHANSGLLPTKVVELPERYISEALERMAITFRSGPLLLEPGTVRLPLATEQHGTWTWIQAKGTQKGDWEEARIVKSDAAAHLSTSPYNLVEGWLKFSPDEIDNMKEEHGGEKTS